MKRFIGVLAFSLLFLAGKADTISRYHVFLGDSMILDAGEGMVMKLKVRAKQLSAADSIRFEYYQGCGGRVHSRYELTIKNSASDEVIYRDSSGTTDAFRIPLGILLEYKKKHPDVVFKGSYRPYAGNSDGARFEIILE